MTFFYCLSRNVPCQRRCKQMEFSGVEKIVEETEGEDGWVTHENDDDDENDINNSVAEMTLESNKLDELREKESSAQDEEEEEALDMEDFEESGMLENIDPSVAIVQPTASKSADPNSEIDSVVHCRSYDLHIVYNKYYQTPHLFLIGYDENKKMLTVDQMFEDVSQDNAKKTVTFEQHPHMGRYFIYCSFVQLILNDLHYFLGPSMLAVHPCRHGDLMKKFIQIVSYKI